MKRSFVIVFGLVFGLTLLVTAVIVTLRIVAPSPTAPPPLPTVTQPPITNAPKSTLLLPTEPTSNGGVDTSAPTVQLSIQEIEKVDSFLPYSQEYTLPSGRRIELIISPASTTSRPWVLPVFVGGIDYQIPETVPAYEQERSAFREAAAILFDWLADKGVDTSAIFINWGERAFIQERAELWLK